jgi:hypothetical protein
VFVLGEDTTEVWYNAANPVGFTFSRVQGATSGHGVASAAAVAEFDGRVFWMTSRGLVVVAAGTGFPVRISDDQVEAALKERRADWGSARAHIYADEGHLFYVLTVGDLTLTYDDATAFWHKRANYSRGHAIGRCYVQAWGKHFVGDDQGRILELAGDAYEDAGEPLVAEVVSMPYTNNGQFSAIGSLEVQMDTGLSPLGGEYHVLLSASADGVRWDADRPMSVGRTGEREKKLEWRKLGARKMHRFRLRISDPFRRSLLAKALVRL